MRFIELAHRVAAGIDRDAGRDEEIAGVIGLTSLGRPASQRPGRDLVGWSGLLGWFIEACRLEPRGRGLRIRETPIPVLLELLLRLRGKTTRRR